MIPNGIFEGADFLWYLDLIATSLSTLGSLWMIYSCLKLPSTGSLSLKFILAIAVSDFFFTTTNVMSNFETPRTPVLCYSEAVLRQFSFIYSIFFSTCTAIASYLSTNPRRKLNKNIFFIFSVIIGFILCLAFTLFLPEFLAGGNIVVAFGPYYCWFTYNKHASSAAKIYIIILYQGFPIITGLVISVFAYIKAFLTLRKLPKEIFEAVGFNIYQVAWYPVVFFFTFIPQLINTFVRVYYPTRPVFIEALHLFFTHSIGFNNALVYGIQRKLYNTTYEEKNQTDSTFIEDDVDTPTDELDSYFRKDSIQESLQVALN